MNRGRVHRTSKAQGFTLVEMLVVLAIAGILASLSVPALSALSKSGNINQSVSGISLTLEQARAYAMANNTYVWVGFAQGTDASGRTVLSLGVVAGTSGQQSDLGNAKYLTIIPLQNFVQMSLKSGLTIDSLTQSGDSGTDIMTSSLASFKQAKGSTSVTLSNVLQYDPQGQASVTSTVGASHGIQIGLQPIQGNNTTSSNVAIFQVASLTGQVQVFRP